MTIAELMQSPDKLALMEELASTGASLAVIEAKFAMREGQLSLWLTKGKEKKRTIYHRFYLMFRSWAADSVLAAQQSLITKNPGKWLDTNTTGRVVEKPSKTTALLSGTTQGSGNITINNPIVIAALEALREAGINPAQKTIEGEVIKNADQ
jgi:hypothetical protein